MRAHRGVSAHAARGEPRIEENAGAALPARPRIASVRARRHGELRHACHHHQRTERSHRAVGAVEEVDTQVITQLKNVAALPWVAHHVAVMPDVHFGKGATVGSVIAMQGAVAPAAVGVDIGCGMARGEDQPHRRRTCPTTCAGCGSAIEDAIPVGFDGARRGRVAARAASRCATRAGASGAVRRRWTRACTPGTVRVRSWARSAAATTSSSSASTPTSAVWLMLHSGSRNIGKELAEHPHRASRAALPHNQALPDRDLAVFLAGTPEMDAYRRDLFWAQEYAALNRADDARTCSPTWCARVLAARHASTTPISLPPQLRRRGGPLRRRAAGDPQGRDPRRRAASSGIIPGSMGTRSYIVRGLGNADVVRVGVARRRPAHEPQRRRKQALHRARPDASRPRASSAARTPASSTRSPAPTRTSSR